MIYIGICDDVDEERQMIYNRCEDYFGKNIIEHEYRIFSRGEEVLYYCEEQGNDVIDLLFLDMKMPGISGIELKDAVINESKVRYIAFVSNYSESVFGAFSKKTIGFIQKPPSRENIAKMFTFIIDEMRENKAIIIKESDGNRREVFPRDIIYMKASGSYTEIVMNSYGKDICRCVLSSKRLGEWENELKDSGIIRVHKSYLLNLEYVGRMKDKAVLKGISLEIPLGRKYREEVKKEYMYYIRGKSMLSTNF